MNKEFVDLVLQEIENLEEQEQELRKSLIEFRSLVDMKIKVAEVKDG